MMVFFQTRLVKILIWQKVSENFSMFSPAEQVIKLVSPYVLLLNWDSLHARLNNRYKAWIYKKKEEDTNVKLLNQGMEGLGQEASFQLLE